MTETTPTTPPRADEPTKTYRFAMNHEMEQAMVESLSKKILTNEEVRLAIASINPHLPQGSDARTWLLNLVDCIHDIRAEAELLVASPIPQGLSEEQIDALLTRIGYAPRLLS